MGLLERWYARRVGLSSVLLLILVVSGYLLLRLRVGPADEGGPRTLAVEMEHVGVDAAEIERTITRPLEDALAVLSGLREIRSVAEYGKTRVTIAVDPEVYESAYLSLRDCVERVWVTLPSSVQRPRVLSGSESQRPVYVASIRSAGGEAGADVESWAERVLKTSYEKIPGVGQVEVGGRVVREIHVAVDARKASALGLGLGEVARQLQRQSALLPLGRMTEAGHEVGVSLRGRFVGLEDMALLRLDLGAGSTVPLGQVADVRPGERERDTLSRVNGEPMVVLAVRGSGGTNAVSLSRELRAETARWAERGVVLEVVLDRGEYLEKQVRGIALELLLGLGLITLILPLVAADLRRLAALGLCLPVALWVSLALLVLAGGSLDPQILAGLAVSTGSVISAGYLVAGQRSAAGVKVTASALAASVLTMLITLAPIPYLSFVSAGIDQVALAMALLLSVSAAIAVLFVPAYVHLRSPSLPVMAGFRRAVRRGLGRRSIRMLLGTVRLAQRYPVPVLLLTFALCLTAGVLLPSAGRDFARAEDADTIFAHVEMEPGATVESVDERIRRFGAELEDIPGVTLVQTLARRGSGEVDLRFDQSKISRDRLVGQVIDYGRRIAGGFVYLPEAEAGGVSLEVAVLGDDGDLLRQIAREAAGAIAQNPWVSQVVLNFKDPPPAIQVVVDHELAAASGVRTAEIAASLRWALHGPVAMKWMLADREIDLRVMDAGLRSATRTDLPLVPIEGPDGAFRALGGLAALTTEASGGKIYRKDRQRALFLTVHSGALSLDALSTRVGAVLQDLDLPRGYAFELDRRVQELRSSFSRLWLVLGLSMLLVYFTLGVVTESVSAPLLILGVIPASAAIPLLAYRLLGEPLRVPILIGLILLTGMAVSSAVLVVQEVRRRAPRTSEVAGAVLRALRRRSGALFVGSTSTLLGVLPLLADRGRTTSVMSDLAFVVFWGVLGSAAAAVLVLPALASVAPRWLSGHPCQRNQKGV